MVIGPPDEPWNVLLTIDAPLMSLPRTMALASHEALSPKSFSLMSMRAPVCARMSRVAASATPSILFFFLSSPVPSNALRRIVPAMSVGA